MCNRFENKIAVVTGGCRGIGKAIVERLLKEGAKVYALDYAIPNAEEVFITDAELAKNAIVKQLDVTNFEQVQSVMDAIIAESQRIDFLINNAGITRDNLLMRMNESDWDAVLSTNLKGVFLCTKVVSRYMMSQRYGRIVNMGSVVGVMGNAGQANYSASKAGLIGFTKSVAKELGSRNILCNYVAPGFVRTPMTDVLSDEVKQEFLKGIPLKRAAEAEDIANVVSFFCSEDASYLTGQVVHIDGGMVM
ncbi:MAG: 3-oxoacyl-[acyl-carrier-protein] reductase [Ignavibacteria bacterium]|jgi:3-oxoacyl-[acyl-carrier protein] reductase|nr:3-oxoacyl-[acyl-carrier-protein] reductase [Ignavibacteria bacterium]